MSLFRTSIHVLTATFFNLSLLACNNNLFQNNSGAGKKSAKSAAKAESGTAGRMLDDEMPMADALSMLKDAPVGDDVFEWNGYSFANTNWIFTDITESQDFVDLIEDVTLKDLQESFDSLAKEDLLEWYSEFSLNYRGEFSESNLDDQEDEVASQGQFLLSAPKSVVDTKPVGNAYGAPAAIREIPFPAFNPRNGDEIPEPIEPAARAPRPANVRNNVRGAAAAVFLNPEDNDLAAIYGNVQ